MADFYGVLVEEPDEAVRGAHSAKTPVDYSGRMDEDDILLGPIAPYIPVDYSGWLINQCPVTE